MEKIKGILILIIFCELILSAIFHSSDVLNSAMLLISFVFFIMSREKKMMIIKNSGKTIVIDKPFSLRMVHLSIAIIIANSAAEEIVRSLNSSQKIIIPLADFIYTFTIFALISSFLIYIFIDRPDV